MSWTTSPLNPLAAERKHVDRMSDDMHRFNTSAASPGEIPGEKITATTNQNFAVIISVVSDKQCVGKTLLLIGLYGSSG